jgi:hypothetical protein
VLRLVSSTTRPDEEVKQKISVVEKRLVDNYGYDNHSARGAQLRDYRCWRKSDGRNEEECMLSPVLPLPWRNRRRLGGVLRLEWG